MDGRVDVFKTVQDIPAEYDAIFEPLGERSIFFSRAWFELLTAHGLEPGVEPVCLGVRDRLGAPAILFPAAVEVSPGKTRTLISLANYYSMLFTLLVRPDLEQEEIDIGLGQLSAQIAAARPRWHGIRLTPLAEDDATLLAFAKILKQTGFAPYFYRRAENWFATTREMSGKDYLAQRPATLRNTIGRRTRKAEREGSLTFRQFGIEGGLVEGIGAFEAVYAGSWKEAEPNPAFIPALAKLCSDRGSLRLGVLYLDDTPIAAQFWIVEDGRATIYKLAHDQHHDALSPGSILSAKMAEWVLDDDRVLEIDFGMGDESYKRSWTPEMRRRMALIAFNKRTATGLFGAFRHILSRP